MLLLHRSFALPVPMIDGCELWPLSIHPGCIRRLTIGEAISCVATCGFFDRTNEPIEQVMLRSFSDPNSGKSRLTTNPRFRFPRDPANQQILASIFESLLWRPTA